MQAIPDVSAQAENFRFFYQGKVGSIGGTSAASPTVASIISLLNDARISKGMSPLGFLIPLLYSKAFSGFNDITAGSNPGCGTTGFNVSLSFRVGVTIPDSDLSQATKGWDPGKFVS
jgi:tripeptidyl-peptidase-1